jgi:hypothetical protein
MKRNLIMLAVLMLLALPVMAGADDQGWMPPDWTPTPPARSTVDPVRLTQLLVGKGVLTAQDYAQLTQPRLSAPPEQGYAKVWRWSEIDNNPVLRIGRSN